MNGLVFLLGRRKSAVDKSASASASGSPFLGHLLLGCTLQACKPYGRPGQSRMSPETVTETSVVYWTGDDTQRALEQHPIVHRQDMAAVLADKLQSMGLQRVGND